MTSRPTSGRCKSGFDGDDSLTRPAIELIDADVIRRAEKLIDIGETRLKIEGQQETAIEGKTFRGVVADEPTAVVSTGGATPVGAASVPALDIARTTRRPQLV